MLGITDDITGITRYTLSLLQSLYKVKSDNHVLDLLISRNVSGFLNFKCDRINVNQSPLFVRNSLSNSLLNLFWKQVILYPKLSTKRVDGLHIPNEKPLFYKTCPTVMTIHDLGDYHSTKRTSSMRHFARRVFLPFSVRKADHIIAVSHTTKNDIVRILKIPASKITVIPEAVSEKFRILNRLTNRCDKANQRLIQFAHHNAWRKRVEELSGILENEMRKT